MKILKHGNCMKFTCEYCKCEWTAAKMECSPLKLFEAPTQYYYNCPECGKRTCGVCITAEDKTPEGENK